MIHKIRIGLPLKFICTISVVIVLTSLSLTWFFIKNQVVQIRSALENRCTMLARNLASSSDLGVLTRNGDFLKKLNDIVVKEDDVYYSIIYDKYGHTLACTENSQAKNLHKEIEPLLSYKMQAATKAGVASENQYLKDIIKLTYDSKSGESVHDTICPIMIERTASEDVGRELAGDDRSSGGKQELVGFARVGISLARMSKQIADTKKGVLVLTSIVVIFGILLSVFLVRIIVRPIKQLAIGTQKLAGGDLGYHVNVQSNDEIGELADSFNQMAADLRKYVKELNKEKEGLLALKLALEQRTVELEDTVSKMKNIQQELLRSEKFATIGRLASSIAHELRNPLASLKNISYYFLKLKTFNMDEKACQMLDALTIDVGRANKIVTDLLDFSKIRKIDKTRVSIDDFINKFLDNVDFGENIHITRELENIEANIDPDRMTQVFVNIFSNARDAMPEGGNITISARKIDSNFLIKISDTGFGMDEQTISHIFDPLFSTKNRGLGLSLSIVKEVIDLHFGKIAVTSKKGEGTAFEMLLPIE